MTDTLVATVGEFTTIERAVRCVRWTGEVTPELSALMGDDDIEIRTSGSPYLVVKNCNSGRARWQRDEIALVPVGSWVIRRVDGSFSVESDEGFRAFYRPV